MTIVSTVQALASALSAPAQLRRIVELHGLVPVLAALLSKPVKLTVCKHSLECFGLQLPFDVLYAETLRAVRDLLRCTDEHSLFTSTSATVAKYTNFTHEALMERELDRVEMCWQLSRDARTVCGVIPKEPFLKAAYCRYCARCLSPSAAGVSTRC